jgi:hypothetical protein
MTQDNRLDSQRILRPIVLACDGSYAMQLATALVSAVDANRSGEPPKIPTQVQCCPTAVAGHIESVLVSVGRIRMAHEVMQCVLGYAFLPPSVEVNEKDLYEVFRRRTRFARTNAGKLRDVGSRTWSRLRRHLAGTSFGQAVRSRHAGYKTECSGRC